VFKNLINPLHGQCLVKGQNVTENCRAEKTTGIDHLDEQLNNEFELASSLFNVNANLFVCDYTNNAFALSSCNLENCHGSVVLGLTMVTKEAWDHGSIAVRGILAHELGHVLQYKLKPNLTNPQKELQADFLAGYYLGRMSYYTPESITPFANSLYSKGDYDYWNPGHHGTPEQRKGIMIAGYNSKRMTLMQAWSYSIELLQGKKQPPPTTHKSQIIYTKKKAIIRTPNGSTVTVNRDKVNTYY